MQLYLEYLIRRKLFNFEATSHISVRTKTSKKDLWMYFLTSHGNLILTFSPKLFNVLSNWTGGFSGRFSRSLADQMEVLFSFVPCLKPIWERWISNLDSLNIEESSIINWCNTGISLPSIEITS